MGEGRGKVEKVNERHTLEAVDNGPGSKVGKLAAVARKTGEDLQMG
jgi:hypothetical protein